MKIDIHVHTKKTKSGDSEQRNVTDIRFKEIISMTDVKILAITNHNHFDLVQYNSFVKNIEGICQIWPGIELDVTEEGRRAHLIIIVNPKNAKEFNRRINKLVNGESEDSFSIFLTNIAKEFDDLDTIYIPHYHSKKPSLLDNEVEKLLNSVSNKKRVLKEATNSISAGIYISHGHNSIYGSDVHNWDDYTKIAQGLPDLRLPVESFEQFCLLLEKDDATINTILKKKSKETIQLNPFNIAAELIDLDIYNDINILFGSKGTGKTDILRALSKYYNKTGFKTNVYESSNVKLEDSYDIKGHSFNTTLCIFGIDECCQELSIIRNATEKNITRLSSYLRYFEEEETNKISKSIKVRNFSPLDETMSLRSFDDIIESLLSITRFKKNVTSDVVLKKVIGDDLYNEFYSVVDKILTKLKSESESRFIDYKSILLFNNLISKFSYEISRKTGQPEKPLTTGFKEYARNRINIERNLHKILQSISKRIEPEINYVGNLGEKGELYCQTNLIIQNGSFINSKYAPINNVQKTPQKLVAGQLDSISKYIYSNKLFEKIAELNSIENSITITCISDLLLFYRHFTLNEKEYSPSNGESSMVLLHNELKEEKDIYIIDEPERSLGNDYISDVIVPLLKEHAQRGKKVIVATHDANIAVRTLPYNSIYRGHDIKGYFTYVGNPFSNNLVCITKDRPNLNWKNISMKTLEGGEEAFGERGKIYGNV